MKMEMEKNGNGNGNGMEKMEMASKWRGISIHGHNTPFSRPRSATLI
jgi:hypothetical protein